jgi:CDGSH-type Zn-finger protein
MFAAAAAFPLASRRMTERVEIKVRENGPYRVKGPITLIDADGNEFELEPHTKNGTIALCRCGGSTTKPFCDGRHSERGFEAAERAVQEADEADAQAEDDA